MESLHLREETTAHSDPSNNPGSNSSQPEPRLSLPATLQAGGDPACPLSRWPHHQPHPLPEFHRGGPGVPRPSLHPCADLQAPLPGRQAHPGLRTQPATGDQHAAFFCQATRLSGLSNAELARSLLSLHKAGVPRAGRGPTRGGRGGTLTQGLRSRPAPHFPPPASPPQGRTAPTLRYRTWPGGCGQNARRGTVPRAPSSDFPSATSPAAPSWGPPRGRPAKAADVPRLPL